MNLRPKFFLLLAAALAVTSEGSVSLRDCRTQLTDVMARDFSIPGTASPEETILELEFLMKSFAKSSRPNDRLRALDAWMKIRELRLVASLRTPLPSVPVVEMSAKRKEFLEVKDILAGKVLATHRFLDTQLYYAYQPNPRKDFPEIDKETKGIVIYFGGSGTKSASGRAFAMEINHLRGFGISAVSFDYPFHALGPRSPEFLKLEHTRRWLLSILERYTGLGLPVVLVGHSYGPKAIVDTLRRKKQKQVIGCVLAAPSALGNESFFRYFELYENGALAADGLQNQYDIEPEGDYWADAVGLQMAHDPGDVSIDQPVHFISGDRDLFVDVPSLHRTAREFRRGSVEIYEDTGHHLFANREKGDVHTRLQRRIIDLFEGTPRKPLPDYRGTAHEAAARIRMYYAYSTAFRRFIQGRRIPLENILNNQFTRQGIWWEWQVHLLEELRTEIRQSILRGNHIGVDRIQPLLETPAQLDHLHLYLKFVYENP